MGWKPCQRSSSQTFPKLALCNSVPVLSGSKRIVILSAYSMIIDLVNQLLEVIFFARQVDFVGIDHQKGGFGVLAEVIIDGPVDLLQVLVLLILLAPPPPFFDPGMQGRGLRLQKNYQVRLGDLDFDQVEQLFIEMQFVAFEIQTRKNPVALEQVIGDHHIVEQIPLGQLLNLLVPVQQKKNLGLEGVGGPVLVKFTHERVALFLFEHQTGAVFFGQFMGQSRFSRPDVLFNGDEPRFVHRVC